MPIIEENETANDIHTILMSFFGFLMSIGLRFFLVDQDDKTIGFPYPSRSASAFNLWLSLIFFVFLWFEWLWTRDFLRINTKYSSHRVKLVANYFIQILVLTTLGFCYFFYLQGAKRPSAILHQTEFWFIWYLCFSSIWSILNPKDNKQGSFNLLNIICPAVFVPLWLLDTFKYNGINLRLYMAIYLIGRIIICTWNICYPSTWRDKSETYKGIDSRCQGHC